MHDKPKFIKIVWEDGQPAALMSDGWDSKNYPMSIPDCDNAIWGWEKLLEESSSIRGVPKQEERVRNGIQQFKVARDAIKAAQRTPRSSDSTNGHVTTEETSKNIKGQMVLSWVLGLIGVVVIALSLGSGKGGGAGIGLLVIGAAILWFFFLKARRWWEHG